MGLLMFAAFIGGGIIGILVILMCALHVYKDPSERELGDHKCGTCGRAHLESEI